MNETNNSAAPTATAETPATADPASAPSGNLQDWIIEWSIIGAILLLILFVAKKKGWLDRIRIFFLQTREELSKCSWPTRDELRGSTWMVLVAVFYWGHSHFWLTFFWATFSFSKSFWTTW